MPYGNRRATVQDPGRNVWQIAMHRGVFIWRPALTTGVPAEAIGSRLCEKPKSAQEAWFNPLHSAEPPATA
jgi:hypothetical protein